MRDVITAVEGWWRAGHPVACGTVVATWQSAPRPPGAAMVVGPDGSVVGSVSGGCVESDVYALAESVRATGVPVVARYGVSDDDALGVGLTCGGTVEIFVERIDRASFPDLDAVAAALRGGRPAAVATLIRDGAGRRRAGRRIVLRDGVTTGSVGSDRIDAAISDDLVGMLEQGRSGVVHYGADGQRRGADIAVFMGSYAPPPRMIVFGAVDFAAAVSRIGGFLGYRVTVCDARATFATPDRFPDADEVIVDWPHRFFDRELRAGRIDARTVVCVLTHDARFDVPLLDLALRVPLAYVGAMGSRRTNADRLARLRRLGLNESQLDRLHAPIGLDLGARTPQETAVSVAAEIIAAIGSGTGSPLRHLDGPIHH